MFRKLLLSLLLVFLLVAGVFLAGPRVDVSYTPGERVLGDDLDAYLRERERGSPGVVAGAEKTIVWAHPDRRKTPLALVYLHGFSATRRETAPLCDDVAAQLGANLFYTRLTGHGLGGEALARASVNDWLNDAVEALRIGERLGERVVIVGCSTGGALAAWLAATQTEPAVAGYVLISPNFAPANPDARYLTWPWARQLIPRFFGERRETLPLNPEHARYWTTSYPTVALLPMMGLCQIAQKLPLERVDKPLLMVYSPRDEVVDVPALLTAFERWGAAKKRALPITPPDTDETHVIAGRIRAPGGTPLVAEAIVQFVSELR
jgi:alpha-beta hydrolase superfamily lysophospholipase